MTHDPAAASEWIKRTARDEGFDLVGVASAAPLDPAPLDRWLAEGWDAGLWYVRDSRDERVDPERLLPGVRSVVVVAVSYRHPDPPQPAEPHGVVARYARARDYHNVMRRPLRRVRDALQRTFEGSRTYASCDTRPVMEKAWAQRAGLGWIGKNGCLIAPPFGSWVLLGCVMTTVELAPDPPHPERCGTCTSCLRSCPTDAFPAPGFVDAGRCIAYHTIEHRETIPGNVAKGLEGRLFGCDACQEVCPWNRAEPPEAGRLSEGFLPRPGQAFVPLSDLLQSADEELESRIQGTPLARAGVKGLRRTARLLAGDPTSEDPS